MKFKRYTNKYIYRLKNAIVEVQYVKNFRIYRSVFDLSKVEDFYNFRIIVLDHYSRIKILELR